MSPDAMTLVLTLLVIALLAYSAHKDQQLTLTSLEDELDIFLQALLG